MASGEKTDAEQAEADPPAGAGEGKTPGLQIGWLRRAQGEAVRVRLLGGKVLAGELVDADVYTLLVRLASGETPVLVYKHAVAYVALGGRGAGGG